MTTYFDIEQAHAIVKTPPDILALCRRYRGANPDNYRLYPDAQKAIFQWQDYEDKVAQSPMVQRSLNSAPPPHPSNTHAARMQQAAANKAMVNRAMTTPGMPVYQEPTQQPAQRSYQPQVNAEVRRSLANVVTELQRLPARIGAILQTPQLVQRSAAPPVSQPANQYPISPLTGQPSSITAVARQSVGAGSYPILNQAPYYQQVTLKAELDAAGQPGTLPISPITGQPSELAAIARRSVGL